MSRRPDFQQPARGQGRRGLGELGLLDPRARPARALDALNDPQYCLDFQTSGNPLQSIQSDADMREIHGNVATLSGFSVSAWIKYPAAAPATGDGILYGGDAISASHWGLGVGTTLTSGVNFWVTAQNTAADRAFSPAFSLNVWHHIVGTFNPGGGGQTISGYLDGSSSGWSTAGTLATPPTLGFNIPMGAGNNFFRNTTTGSFWNGRLFGVQYWNRPLLASEALNLYNGGIPLQKLTLNLVSGLRLWWKMGNSYQERQRGIIYDVSGNGFHARLRSDVASPTLPTFVLDAP